MSRILWGVLALVLAGSTAAVLYHHLHPSSGPLQRAHSEFSFTVHAPMAAAFPLFGPEGERPWAGHHWNPKFVFPTPAKDTEGAVFHVAHGHHDSTWVNTAFDPEHGHAAYVYIIDRKLATRIDVQLTPADAQTTTVRVMYERTALSPSVNEDILEMAQTDPKMGLEWEQRIEKYLRERTSR